MPGSAWDQVSYTDAVKLQIYPNVIELLKVVPHDPNNRDLTAVSDKLRAAMERNENGFRGKLDDALENPDVRRRIGELARTNPAALNQNIDAVIRNPQNVRATLDSIEGAQRTAQQTTVSPPPATTPPPAAPSVAAPAARPP